jgi:hypothetical protein
MNALKETSLVIQMQLASIHKDHTTVNVNTDSKGMERRTAQQVGKLSEHARSLPGFSAGEKDMRFKKHKQHERSFRKSILQWLSDKSPQKLD